jgi:hypothetical protein
MEGVHGVRRAIPQHRLDGVRSSSDKRRERRTLIRIEITQDEPAHVSVRGASNSTAHTHEVASEVLEDRSQAVVASVTSAHLDPHFPVGNVELVVDHHRARSFGLKERRGGSDGDTAAIHIGRGLEQVGVLVSESCFGVITVEFIAKAARRAPVEFVDYQEPDVVTVALILRARVPETDDQPAHDAVLLVRALFGLIFCGLLALLSILLKVSEVASGLEAKEIVVVVVERLDALGHGHR